MPRSRDRHGRGVRGALSLPNPITGRPAPVRRRPTRAEFFLTCIEDSLARIAQFCPDCLEGIDIGVEDVPTQSAMWQGLTDHGAVPLAGAIDAADDHAARVVIYRRPLERRATDQAELRELVHRTLVEQLAVMTGRSITSIDPDVDDD